MYLLGWTHVGKWGTFFWQSPLLVHSKMVKSGKFCTNPKSYFLYHLKTTYVKCSYKKFMLKFTDSFTPWSVIFGIPSLCKVTFRAQIAILPFVGVGIVPAVFVCVARWFAFPIPLCATITDFPDASTIFPTTVCCGAYLPILKFWNSKRNDKQRLRW